MFPALIIVPAILLLAACTQAQTPAQSPSPVPTSTPNPSPAPQPTATPEPTPTSIPTSTPEPVDERSQTLPPDQVFDAVADVYGQEVLVRDLDHLMKCRDAVSVGEARSIPRSTVEGLAVLIDGYPAGYLLRIPAEEQNMDFRSFTDTEVELWCIGITQNIEEHLLMRAWGLVLLRAEDDGAEDVLVLEWENVATTLQDFGEMIAGMSQPGALNPSTAALYERVFADFRTPPDALSNPWALGDFEQDAETWARCVTYIDDRTDGNLDMATEAIAAYSERYSILDPAKVLQLRRSEKKFVTGPLCVAFKSSIEKRMVANLVRSSASK